MNEFVRQKLVEVVKQYGVEMVEDPMRLEALLAYVCDDEMKPEIRVLISALNQNIAHDLLAAPKGMPIRLLVPSLAKRLEDNLGLTKDDAVWAVESWALSLGFDLPGQQVSQAEDGAPVDWSDFAWSAWWSVKNFPSHLWLQTRLSWALLLDARVPVRHKLIPIVATAYIFSPLGLIVDLIPIAGMLANVAVYMLALATFNNLAPADVVAEHMTRLRSPAKPKRSAARPDRGQPEKTPHKSRPRRW